MICLNLPSVGKKIRVKSPWLFHKNWSWKKVPYSTIVFNHMINQLDWLILLWFYNHRFQLLQHLTHSSNYCFILLYNYLSYYYSYYTMTAKYPCKICHKAVAKRHWATQCDNCNLWVQIKCNNINLQTYVFSKIIL